MYKRNHRIHFVGIGGIGMSGIAEVLINLGYTVSGSDARASETTDRLAKIGATISIGHAAANVADADVVVVSSAIKGYNPEVKKAEDRFIPVIPRAEMLAELMRMKYGIAIAGSHGKTTTTSLIAAVLGYGGLDPTIVTGGRLRSTSSPAHLGKGEFLVAEADESDGSFLKLVPTIAVLTNIDPEHMDFYGDMDCLRDTFLAFVNKVPFFGLGVVCLDHENIQKLIPRIEKRFTTYGLSTQADFQARNITRKGLETSFEALYMGNPLGEMIIRLPGEHNVCNALAAVAVAVELEIEIPVVQKALREFTGIHRRFEILADSADLLLVDDYGHHPAEVRATLQAARDGWDRRIVTVFQPHRYSRTQALEQEFYTAFHQSDVVIITGIYSAGEDPIEGVTAESIYEGTVSHGHKGALYVPEMDGIIDVLMDKIRPGDMIITLGAGSVTEIGPQLLARIEAGREGDR